MCSAKAAAQGAGVERSVQDEYFSLPREGEGKAGLSFDRPSYRIRPSKPGSTKWKKQRVAVWPSGSGRLPWTMSVPE